MVVEHYMENTESFENNIDSLVRFKWQTSNLGKFKEKRFPWPKYVCIMQCE